MLRARRNFGSFCVDGNERARSCKIRHSITLPVNSLRPCCFVPATDRMPDFESYYKGLMGKTSCQMVPAGPRGRMTGLANNREFRIQERGISDEYTNKNHAQQSSFAVVDP